MVRWKVRGCPRCGGTTFIDKDDDGWYEYCMMCSNRIDLNKATNSTQNSEERKPKTPRT